jgi:uncharacterized protein YjbJ (UPF0337 family)
MNTHQINGTLWILAGKIQEQVGRATRNKRKTLCGLQRQVLGAAEKRVGDYRALNMRSVSQRHSLHL